MKIFVQQTPRSREHDFGAFEFEGAPIMFKIDYYDKELDFHSPDLADPTVTELV